MRELCASSVVCDEQFKSCSPARSGLGGWLGWLAARCTWSRGLWLQVKTCSLRYFPPFLCRAWWLAWTVTVVNQQYSTRLTEVKGNHDKMIPFYLTAFIHSLMHLIALKVKMADGIWVKMQQNNCFDFFIRLGLDFIQILLGWNKGHPKKIFSDWSEICCKFSSGNPNYGKNLHPKKFWFKVHQNHLKSAQIANMLWKTVMSNEISLQTISSEKYLPFWTFWHQFLYKIYTNK